MKNLCFKQLADAYKASSVSKVLSLRIWSVFLLCFITSSCDEEIYDPTIDNVSVIAPDNESMIALASAANVNWTKRTINSFPAANQIKALSYKRGVCREGNEGTGAMYKMFDLGAESATYHFNLKKMSKFFPTKNSNKIDPEMVDVLKKAYNRSKNITYYLQVSGIPRNTYQEENVPKSSGGNFYPLPVSAERTQCAKNIANWMVETEDALPANMKIVWLGTQEPEHTLGKPSGDFQTNNINKFIDYWKVLTTEAKRLKSGMEFGGIQSNSGISSRYPHVKNRINSTGLKSNIKFLSFQLYGPGGTGGDGGIRAAKNAASDLGREMLVHRGAWLKELKRAKGLSSSATVDIDKDGFNTSEGMLYYLRMEKQYQAVNANIEGYSVARVPDNLNWMFYNVFEWLQEAPPNLRQLNHLPNGVDGFVLANKGKYYAFLYNTSNNNYQLKLNLNTAQYGANAKLSTWTLSGGNRTSNANYMTYNHSNKAIMKVRLQKNDVVMVKLVK